LEDEPVRASVAGVETPGRLLLKNTSFLLNTFRQAPRADRDRPASI
jgi:hypothetical protein